MNRLIVIVRRPLLAGAIVVLGFVARGGAQGLPTAPAAPASGYNPAFPGLPQLPVLNLPAAPEPPVVTPANLPAAPGAIPYRATGLKLGYVSIELDGKFRPCAKINVAYRVEQTKVGRPYELVATLQAADGTPLLTPAGEPVQCALRMAAAWQSADYARNLLIPLEQLEAVLGKGTKEFRAVINVRDVETQRLLADQPLVVTLRVKD